MITQAKPACPPENVTRIDLIEIDGAARGFPDISGVRVLKWLGFMPLDSHEELERQWGRPSHESINEKMTIFEMAAWLRRAGYVVYEWPGGARAFWGKPKPVRTTIQILRLRDRLTQRKASGDPTMANVHIHTLDLRYVW